MSALGVRRDKAALFAVGASPIRRPNANSAIGSSRFASVSSKKLIYDLWGDAVNIASRMESQGQSQSIQITGNTFRLIKDEFVCEAKGTIKVKGGGQLEVWHVLGRKAT